MRSLFGSRTWKSWEDIKSPIPLPQLELISIHVEKTAGTSFYHELIHQYGAEAVLRVDTHQHDVPYFNQQEKLNMDQLSSVRVLHGHFTKNDLNTYFKYPEKAVQTITWIRDPAERILSNYHHLIRRLNDYVDNNKSPQLLEKMIRSFDEFIEHPINQNRMALYIEDYAYEDFFFIGQVERYQEDLQSLAKLLHWDENKLQFSKLNDANSKQESLTAMQKERIRYCNPKDFSIYEYLTEKINGSR